MSTKTTYKQTELGLIPTDWDFDNMGNLSKVNQGLQIPISDRFSEQVENSLFYITNEFLKEDSKNKYFIKNPPKSVIANKDDVLMTRTGNTGKVVTGVEGAFHNNFFKIKYDETKLNKDFLVGYLKSPRTQYSILTLSGNSTIPDLNHSDFYRIKIPLPPLPEQKKIADCLSTWDSAIEKQSALINALTDRKKALMQQLLTGKKRLPGFSEEWKEVSFEKLLKQIKRKEEWDDKKLYKLLSVKRRSEGIFDREHLFGYQIAVKELMKVKKDDFLISKMQIVHGASALVNDYFENYYVSGSYIVLNIRDKRILNPEFLNYYSKQKLFYYQTYLSSYGVHIEKMTFDFKTFLKIEMTIPSLEEQTAIAEILATADRELQLQKDKLAQLQSQKKGLMQVLLTGKKRLIN